MLTPEELARRKKLAMFLVSLNPVRANETLELIAEIERLRDALGAIADARLQAHELRKMAQEALNG